MAVERLIDLVAEINQEHQLVYRATLDALGHAIKCGEHLIEARKHVPDGQWSKWVADNLMITTSVAARYRRLATYREHLMSAEDRPETINAALAYLHDIDAPSLPHGRSGKRPTFDVAEAQRLREAGMTYNEIGKAVGVSGVAVRYQLEPMSPEVKENRARQTRDRRARQRAEAEQEIANRIRHVGGALHTAYHLLQDCIEALSQALIEADDDELFGALSIALTNTQRAEGVITRVFK